MCSLESHIWEGMMDNKQNHFMGLKKHLLFRTRENDFILTASSMIFIADESHLSPSSTDLNS